MSIEELDKIINMQMEKHKRMVEYNSGEKEEKNIKKSF